LLRKLTKISAWLLANLRSPVRGLYSLAEYRVDELRFSGLL
jgi:hypothetical protein